MFFSLKRLYIGVYRFLNIAGSETEVTLLSFQISFQIHVLIGVLSAS